jgi:hypothetical protein
MTYSVEQFKIKHQITNIDNINPLSYQKLKQSCENAKKRLSEVSKTSIIVPNFYDEKDLFINITKETYESICKELFILCLKPISDVLKSCKMTKDSIDEIILVGGCTRMPQIRENIKTFFNGKEPNISVNPDEVVAMGAAIQGYILSNKTDPFSENITLLDVVPLSLGVEIIGGIMNTVIPRNSIIPITKKRKYTNDDDNETFIGIKIFEGERKMTKDNYLVGEFELTGITPALRGINQFEITFSVDVNGIINVTAIDLSNVDNKKTITINSNKGRLTPDKIKTLIEEAKIYEIKDKTEREKKTLYYNVEDACITIKANIQNEEFKIKEKDKDDILKYVNGILDMLKNESYMAIDKKRYTKLLEDIKLKYGTLVIKVSNELDNVKNACNNDNGASIYNDNDDEDEIITKELYEELENNELGIKNSENSEIRKEIKRLREMLVSLCYSVLEMIDNLDNMEELRGYIDDVLLWVYVKEQLSIEDYKDKINEVNNVCNDIVDKGHLVINNDISPKKELEQLCFTVLQSIMPLDNVKVKYLKTYIEETLNFIVDNDDNDDDIINEKINCINMICDEIYEDMSSNYGGTSIEGNPCGDNVERKEVNYIDDEEDEEDGGTSIASLLKKNKL